jgi:hypothetical protein
MTNGKKVTVVVTAKENELDKVIEAVKKLEELIK